MSYILPKRIVKELARYHGFEKQADRIPNAGLEPNQSDFKDLGYSYDMVELFSEGVMQGLSIEELYTNTQRGH